MEDTQFIQCRVDLETAASFKELCKDNHFSQSAMLSSIIREYLKQHNGPTTEVSMTDGQMIQAIFDKIQSMSAGTTKMTPSSGNRVMIFLDVRNVTTLDRNAKICFADMVDYLVAGREVMAQYAYDSVRYGSDGVDIAIRFHDFLRGSGFDLRLRDSTNEATQKEVDVALAVDMIENAYDDNYDTAILISGDRDFVPAVEKIKAKGKKVEVASFDECMSSTLAKKANRSYNLDDLFIIQLMDPETAARYEHKGAVE